MPRGHCSILGVAEALHRVLNPQGLWAGIAERIPRHMDIIGLYWLMSTVLAVPRFLSAPAYGRSAGLGSGFADAGRPVEGRSDLSHSFTRAWP